MPGLMEAILRNLGYLTSETGRGGTLKLGGIQSPSDMAKPALKPLNPNLIPKAVK